MSSLPTTADVTTAGPDEDAASLFELYRQRIRDYCYGQLRDRQEAEDALQATFLYAFTLLKRGTKPKRPLPWLYTIAHNVCRTRRRALRRRKQIESGVDLEVLNEVVGRDDPSHEDLAELASSLAMLPPTQRDALLLREWQGFSYAEIAARLELTESAVEAVLFRARRNLARALRPVAERVASVVNGILLLPLLRRFAPLGGNAKASAAALLAGTAAATTLLPLADAPRRPIAAPNSTSHVIRPRVSPPPAVPASPQPGPAPSAAPQPAVRLTASVPAVLSPTAPAPASAAATQAGAGAATTASSRPTAPAPATPATATVPAPPPAPVPADPVAATDAAANAVSSATATADAVTSDVESTAQSAASIAQSTVSAAANAVSELPIPPNTPLQGGP